MVEVDVWMAACLITWWKRQAKKRKIEKKWKFVALSVWKFFNFHAKVYTTCANMIALPMSYVMGINSILRRNMDTTISKSSDLGIIKPGLRFSNRVSNFQTTLGVFHTMPPSVYVNVV